jgi:hypothetical protein
MVLERSAELLPAKQLIHVSPVEHSGGARFAKASYAPLEESSQETVVEPGRREVEAECSFVDWLSELLSCNRPLISGLRGYAVRDASFSTLGLAELVAQLADPHCPTREEWRPTFNKCHFLTR